MKLIITEKPSVGQSIGRVLGASKRCDGYLEGNGYLVSWCVGSAIKTNNQGRRDGRKNMYSLRKNIPRQKQVFLLNHMRGVEQTGV